MVKHVQKSVGNHLASKTNAQALSQLEMGQDCSLAVWLNTKDQVTYEHTEGHALSFYLSGGQQVSRLDQNKGYGWPGSMCIMPQGHSSIWQVEDRLEFIHVYLSDQELRRQFAQTFDKDARLLDVKEQTFVEAGDLSRHFLSLQEAAFTDNPILAEESICALIYDAMTSGVLGEAKQVRLTGGLPPKKMALIKEYAVAHLDQHISLKDLATLAHLSEYHFQRNFKAQCGVSPHRWLTCLKIDHAKDLMRKGQSQVDIAHACAFSSQSHFSRTFKKYTGRSPGAYMEQLIR